MIISESLVVFAGLWVWVIPIPGESAAACFAGLCEVGGVG